MSDQTLFCMVKSPVGNLLLESDGTCLLSIRFITHDTSLGSILPAKNRLCKKTDPIFAPTILQLSEYFGGLRTRFTIKWKLEGTPFQEAVFREIAKIPYGQTRAYSELAKRIHQPKAARAVGRANHQNPLPIIVPCHRVIGKNGSLVGYGAGLEIKKYLLHLEMAGSKNPQ